MYLQTEMFSFERLCGMYIWTEMFSGDWLCGMYLRSETISPYNCIFQLYCTYFRIWALSGRTRPHFAERVCQEGISPTVSGSCGKDPPIAHTHLATVPNAVAKRVKNRLYRTLLYQWSYQSRVVSQCWVNYTNGKIVNIVCNGNDIINNLIRKIVYDVSANGNVFLGLPV